MAGDGNAEYKVRADSFSFAYFTVRTHCTLTAQHCTLIIVTVLVAVMHPCTHLVLTTAYSPCSFTLSLCLASLLLCSHWTPRYSLRAQHSATSFADAKDVSNTLSLHAGILISIVCDPLHLIAPPCGHRLWLLETFPSLGQHVRNPRAGR